jgi:glutamate-ammonia-ligase adenylyltransferase
VTKLTEDVIDMRRRMRKELCKQKPGKFDIKQAAGGIADIEFMVQYSVLRWAPLHMPLLHWTDDIRLLETLAQQGLWTKSDAEGVSAAYKAYRNMAHHLTLQGEPILANENDFVEERQLVKQVWFKLFAESL